MKAKDIMHREPAFCTPETGINEVARLMIDCDCGAIPVVKGSADRRLVGIVTDRDIVCRAVAENKVPSETRAGGCMSTTVATAGPDSGLDDCVQIMKRHQVRRLPVVDEEGFCVGMLTQAQISRHAGARQTAKLVREVSRKKAQAPVGVGTDF